MQSSNSINNVPRSDARWNDNANVAYGLDRYSWNQGYNAKYDCQIFENEEPALVARGGRRFAVIPKGDKCFMCDRLQVGTESTSGREQADNMQKEKVFVLNEQDKKGDSITEDKTNALLKDPKRQPVICLNDQGGLHECNGE